MTIGEINKRIAYLQRQRDLATAGSETLSEIKSLAAPFDAEIAELRATVDGWCRDALASLKAELESPEMAAKLNAYMLGK